MSVHCQALLFASAISVAKVPSAVGLEGDAVDYF